MLQTLLIVGSLYVAVLMGISWYTRQGTKSAKDYLWAGSNLGAFLGLFTFAATLFSTFTLLGMPDFFRTHGVAAWIFLAVADAVMVFAIIWVGYLLRKRIQSSEKEYNGMAGYMRYVYKSPWAGYVIFAGAFLFLIPYVAIQIRGVSIFLNQAFPESIPLWGWATGIVIIMLIYSELGGLKAIIYSDVLQGVLLLIVVWIIGVTLLDEMGGMTAMFDKVEAKNPALLSAPGPKGLFDAQFLFGSMIAIVMIPFTQPQVSTRLMIMKDTKSLYRMALGVGGFAILVILPTLFIGMYGALNYADVGTQEFLGKALINDQTQVIAVMVTIGLIAAAISTSDSQLFALGAETKSLLKGDETKTLTQARISIAVFAVLALIFSLLTNDQLALLARTSFAGTALMAPMIFLGIFHHNPSKLKWMAFATLGAILVFIFSSFGMLPGKVASLRMDILLLLLLGIAAVVGGKQVKQG